MFHSSNKKRQNDLAEMSVAMWFTTDESFPQVATVEPFRYVKHFITDEIHISIEENPL